MAKKQEINLQDYIDAIPNLSDKDFKLLIEAVDTQRANRIEAASHTIDTLKKEGK